ncbi:MAG: glucose 1-dehydrogenase [Burkholderiales bacterium]|nr:glucose 1-dehydrogenase [Burkholderiales bacterium]
MSELVTDRGAHQLSLHGQRAIVTGANSGIGEGIVRALAEAGAAVVVNYVRGADAAERIVGDIRDAGGTAIAIAADVSREDEVEGMFRAAVEAFGSIDILVNNAGLQKDAKLHEMSLADWNHVIAVNLTGQFLCARAAVREFMRRGVQPQLSMAAGKIICVSSVHDAIPWAGHANYAASKGGVAMLMKTMAQELAMHKIRVNSVSPGAIKTPINTSAWDTPEAERELLRLIPYGRVGETRDIARAAVWLASDHSDYVNGATLYVDGGMTLYPEFRTGG